MKKIYCRCSFISKDCKYYTGKTQVYIIIITCRWMDAVGGVANRVLVVPVRGACLRWCGQGGVDLLEEVMETSSEVTSTTRSSAPLIPQLRLRSRLLGRLRSRPLVFNQVAQMAAQAAQVDFKFSHEISLFLFLHDICHFKMFLEAKWGKINSFDRLDLISPFASAASPCRTPPSRRWRGAAFIGPLGEVWTLHRGGLPYRPHPVLSLLS